MSDDALITTIALDEWLAAKARIAELETALNILLPGLIFDLRYAEDDEDKDAMRARIETVETALAGSPSSAGANS